MEPVKSETSPGITRLAEAIVEAGLAGQVQTGLADKIAGTISSRNRVEIFYECSSCEGLAGNTDGNLAVDHIDEMNKGRHRDSNSRHEIHRRIAIIEVKA